MKLIVKINNQETLEHQMFNLLLDMKLCNEIDIHYPKNISDKFKEEFEETLHLVLDKADKNGGVPLFEYTQMVREKNES